jgi:hypothetical protein
VLFPHHDGHEAAIRRALRLSGHEVVFDDLTPENLARADLVVPLDLPDLERLDDLREHLPPGGLPVPTRESVALCDDKAALLEHLRAAGFQDALVARRAPGEFPFVLKDRRGFGSHGVWIVRDELRERELAQVPGASERYAETFLPGSSEVALHCARADVELFFALGLRFHYAREDGIKNQDRVERLEFCACPHLELFERMLAAVGFEGLCCFNYKEVAGRPVVFEINPRFGASLAPLSFRLLRALVPRVPKPA